MRHLIITAHPSSKGFTHKIAKAFLHRAHENGDEAEILDLYNPRYKLENLKFENLKSMKSDSVVEEIQDKMRLADNYVFIYPIWWYSFPAIFKNFLDKVFTPGFAYKYETGKIMPNKLLKGKTCQVFSTCDGPNYFYFFTGNFGKKIIRSTCMLCGIKVKNYTLLSSRRNKSEKQLNNFLKLVERKV